MPPPVIDRIGPRPRAAGPPPPPPAPAVRRKVRPDREYVAAGGTALGEYFRSTPPWVDLFTRDFGPDLYDRMQLDDQVSSSLRALVHSALADDLTARPAVNKKEDDGYAPSKQLLEFVERATATLDTETWLLAMLKGAVGGGNRVSETVYGVAESGPDAGLWRVDRLKVKPRRSLAFVVDPRMNLAGFLALLTGRGSVTGFGAVTFDPANPPENFIPREKFVHLCWDPKDGEPGGTPILQCVYRPWWEKLQAAREWLAHLARFGSGALVGTLPPDAEAEAAVDAEGNPTGEPGAEPAQAYLNKIVAFQNGSAIVKGHGYELELLQSSNAGTAFLNRVDYSDRAIARGVLLAMRTTMEAKTGSKADAEAAQDVTGLQTRFVKRWAARAITEQLFRPLVRYNFGREAARLWCPYASLSPVEHQDLGATLVSMAQAYKLDFLKPSQLPWAYEQFGIPVATPEEMKPPEPPAAPPGQAPGPGQPPGPPPPDVPQTAPFARDPADADLVLEEEIAGLTREELLAVLLDAGIEAGDGPADDAPFYDPSQPRHPAGSPQGGRWVGGVGTATQNARDAAHRAVRDFAAGKGPPTARDAHAVALHLARLTVAQIHALKAGLGIKGSGPNKAALVAKIAGRIRAVRGQSPAPAPAPPAPQTYQQWVAAGRPGLAPAGQPPPNAPAPAPAAPPPAATPAAPPPAPAAPVPHRGANVITGAPAAVTAPAVPYRAEQVWTTGKPEPGVLNGIPFAPAPPKFWEKVKDVDVKEPPPTRPVNRAGVLIREPDGRVWIVQPTNQYGKRNHTLPGGGVEPGLSAQQNALKEVWEETGLQVEITGYAGDFEDSNNKNNGRLYIGRRVGGAPWDAKVEPHIVSQKTGNPAAESETVTLVTPERAAQLLHRTDDLAQLMVVHPPPVDTPVRGKGSEPLKKLVAAIGPAAREYERKRQAAGAYAGNAELHAVQDLRGFNGKPKVVSKSDFDALLAKGGHTEVLRGVKDHGYGASKVTARQLADQYRDGEHFPGHGIFGSGTYADATKGPGNAAPGYAGANYGGGGEVLRMALPKDAKIIDESELEKLVPANPDAFTGYAHTPYGKAARECWLGVQAALAGYDAIRVDGKSGRYPGYGQGFYVILNRSIVTVQDKAPRPGYVIP